MDKYDDLVELAGHEDLFRGCFGGILEKLQDLMNLNLI